MSAFQAEDRGSIPLTRSDMTYVFFVQGEGRGHLTQALTLKAKLEEKGHEILAVIAGPEPDHGLPAFFEEQVRDKLFRISSPKFVVDKRGKGIDMGRSVLRALRGMGRYLKSMRQIRKIISEKKPDAIINFYEPLAGAYARCYRDRRPFFCIAHQYFSEHQAFEFPEGNLNDRFGLRFYNGLTSPSHSLRIALSFTEEKDMEDRRIKVCPPLIRPLLKQQETDRENFILVYLLNRGYSQEIIDWNEKNPDTRIEVFWNNPDSETTIINDNLSFHHLHGEKFLNRLAHCSAYVSTAGFDSISEAAYLQKDIMMVPTQNHFEQKCNARDAKRAKIAISSDNFNLSLIADKQKTRPDAALAAFKEWVDKNEDKIISILENL